MTGNDDERKTKTVILKKLRNHVVLPINHTNEGKDFEHKILGRKNLSMDSLDYTRIYEKG